MYKIPLPVELHHSLSGVEHLKYISLLNILYLSFQALCAHSNTVYRDKELDATMSSSVRMICSRIISFELPSNLMCIACTSCQCMQKRYYLNKYSHYSANHLSNSYNHVKKAVNIRYFSTYKTYKAGLPIGYQGYKTLNSNIHRFFIQKSNYKTGNLLGTSSHLACYYNMP